MSVALALSRRSVGTPYPPSQEVLSTAPCGIRGSRPSSPWGGAASLCVSAPRLYPRWWWGLASSTRARQTTGLEARCFSGAGVAHAFGFRRLANLMVFFVN